MNWRRARAALFWTLALAIGGVLIAAAFNIRSPALIAYRPWPPVALAAICLTFAAAAWLTRRRAAMAFPVLGLVMGVWVEAGFARLKSSVLAAPQDELRAVGRHLIVGYGAFDELEPLVVRAGVAGVFIDARNARAKSEAQLAAEIARLQALRAAAGLPPLWIASDQEGGVVSALSPPLRRPLPLSSLAHSGELVVNEAEAVARDLACVGVNLNFAPVVDRNYRIIEPGNGFTQISRRAISSDERVIALSARDYCRALDEAGVQCTLKHFPGIGAVKGDTHLRRAVLPGLDDNDLFPFRELADEAPWIMLSHVTVESLDPARPASASGKVMDILRRDWGFDGVLVTDGIAMTAFAENFERNVLGAMGGGADLLLASYDPDLAWEALDILLRARRGDAALQGALAASDARLAGRGARAPVCRRLAQR